MTDRQAFLMIVIFLVSFTLLYWTLNERISNIWAFMQVKRTPNDFNDDDSAVSKVIPLVDQAKELLEIYDDGDNFPESMYNNEHFVSSVEKRLEANKDLRVECLFNEDEDLLFTTRLASNPRVDIYIRFRGEKNEVHYKIMDKGLKAYVSIHDPDDKRRRAFKETDCSGVPKKKLEYVTGSIFGNIRQDRQDFKKKELIT